jgi:hypothetical protein
MVPKDVGRARATAGRRGKEKYHEASRPRAQRLQQQGVKETLSTERPRREILSPVSRMLEGQMGQIHVDSWRPCD